MLTKRPENPLLIFWLLLYLIPYLFVLRSSNNLYLARFHGLQCSLMTFRCYPCTTFSIYYDWNFRKLLSLLRIQIPCFMRISCKKTVPLKFLIFSSTLGTITTASFVPRAPSIKSFCIYLDY